MKQRRRRPYEEEAEVLLYRRGRCPLVKKRQRFSCEEEEEVLL